MNLNFVVLNPQSIKFFKYKNLYVLKNFFKSMKSKEKKVDGYVLDTIQN